MQGNHQTETPPVPLGSRGERTGAGPTGGRPARRDRGLLLIALFKLGKSLLSLCVGIGIFHLMNRDLALTAQHLVHALRFDPESRFTTLLLDKVDLIDAHRLRQFQVFAFGYSALALTEGVGLYLEKVWAEYLTLGLTVSFLPWELYELAQRPSWFRLSLLLINLAVLGYLLWYLRRKGAFGGRGDLTRAEQV